MLHLISKNYDKEEDIFPLKILKLIVDEEWINRSLEKFK